MGHGKWDDNAYAAAKTFRAAKGIDDFGYTAALQSVGGTWTCARLDRWLTNPAAFAPGTSMHFPGLRDGLTRADVIAYLYANGGGKPDCR